MARHPGLGVLALIVVALIVGLSAAAHAKTPLPSSPGNRSVHDLAKVLSVADASSMERSHRALFAATGVAIVVVTVPALQDETIADFALRVGESWGAGTKQDERGIVVAFARDDRRIFVATGYGVEGYLPDGKVGRMIDSYAIPSLRANDFSTGLAALSNALVAASASEFNVTIADLPAQTGPPTQAQGRSLSVRDIIVGVLGVALFLYLAIRHPGLLFFLLLASGGRGGRGGGGFGGGGAGRGF